MITLEYIYNLLGIQDFIYFITAPVIQETLFPIKLVFIFFTIFLFSALMYFYINSSYLKSHFFQDTVEFLSWQPYGLRQINKRWQRISKMVESGNEKDYKMAIIEADDFLYKALEDKGYQGETFEELVKNAEKKILSKSGDLLLNHELRNAIVYDSNYKLNLDIAKKVLKDYENAVKNI